jgi:hypothetical protein
MKDFSLSRRGFLKGAAAAAGAVAGTRFAGRELIGSAQAAGTNQPASLTGSGPTFGQPGARWYTEPQASAVSIYQAFTVAFDGCLTYTATPPQYATAPDATSAATECTAMTRKFWSRNATPDEIASCVNVATVDAAKETDAKRKWAYTCAAVMTSAGFVTY